MSDVAFYSKGYLWYCQCCEFIEAPSSIKNQTGERDPEMRQTKKGNQWHFGMKAHIGVDARTGLTHSFTTAAAN